MKLKEYIDRKIKQSLNEFERFDTLKELDSIIESMIKDKTKYESIILKKYKKRENIPAEINIKLEEANKVILRVINACKIQYKKIEEFIKQQN